MVAHDRFVAQVPGTGSGKGLLSNDRRFPLSFTPLFLLMYPYELDGFRLVDAPFKSYLTPVNGYQFPNRTPIKSTTNCAPSVRLGKTWYRFKK